MARTEIGNLTALDRLVNSLFGPYNYETGLTCTPPTSYPPPPSGAMQYVYYDNVDNVDLNEIEATFMVESDMGYAEGTYVQLGEADLGPNHHYYGIQTDAIGSGGLNSEQLLIASKFITISPRDGNAAEVRMNGDTFSVLGTEGSHFASIRRIVSITTNQWHTFRVARAEAETLVIDSVSTDGHWFDYYFDGENIGGIWYEDPAPAVAPAFDQNLVAWTEFYLNNGEETLYPVPEQAYRLKPLKFNGTFNDYTEVNTVYSPMPNSDTAYVTAAPYDGYFLCRFGGETPRCHADYTLIDVSIDNTRTMYLALHTTTPDCADVGTEVSGGGYNRVPCTFTPTVGTLTTFGTRVLADPAPALGYEFGPATDGTWGTVTAFSVWDAPTGGNLVAWIELETGIEVADGDTVMVDQSQQFSVAFNRTGLEAFDPDYAIACEDFHVQPGIAEGALTTLLDGCYLGLLTSMPSNAFGFGYEEVSAETYSRHPISFATQTDGDPAVVSALQVDAITFATGGTWGIVAGVGLFATETGNTLIATAQFALSEPPLYDTTFTVDTELDPVLTIGNAGLSQLYFRLY